MLLEPSHVTGLPPEPVAVTVHQAGRRRRGLRQLCSRCGFVLFERGTSYWPAGSWIRVTPGRWDSEHARVTDPPTCEAREER